MELIEDSVRGEVRQVGVAPAMVADTIAILYCPLHQVTVRNDLPSDTEKGSVYGVFFQ